MYNIMQESPVWLDYQTPIRLFHNSQNLSTSRPHFLQGGNCASDIGPLLGLFNSLWAFPHAFFDANTFAFKDCKRVPVQMTKSHFTVFTLRCIDICDNWAQIVFSQYASITYDAIGGEKLIGLGCDCRVDSLEATHHLAELGCGYWEKRRTKSVYGTPQDRVQRKLNVVSDVCIRKFWQ